MAPGKAAQRRRLQNGRELRGDPGAAVKAAGILDMPDDVLGLICSHVSTSDKQKNLQRVSMKFRKVLRDCNLPCVWRLVKVNFEESNHTINDIITVVKWIVKRQAGISAIQFRDVKSKGSTSCASLMAVLGAIVGTDIELSVTIPDLYLCKSVWGASMISAAATSLVCLDVTSQNFQAERGDWNVLCTLQSLRAARLRLLRHSTAGDEPPPVSVVQCRLTKLVSLELRACTVSIVPLLAAATGFQGLTQLQIKGCSVSQLPSAFAQLSCLQSFTLRENQNLTALPDMTPFTRLAYLDVSGNKQLANVPAALQHLQSVRSLRVHDVNKSGVPLDNAFVEAVRGLPVLRFVSLVKAPDWTSTIMFHVGALASYLEGIGAVLVMDWREP